MRTLLNFLIAFAALTAIYAGPFVLLPAVGAVESAYGRGWGMAALGAAFALCTALLWGLSHVADRGAAHLEPTPGRAPRDRLFCLRCGAAAAPDEVVCRACGSARFGLAAPVVAAQAAPALTPATPGMLAVLRRRDFGLLWVGQFVSVCGDYLLLVGLPYYVYDRTGSALATGAMFVAQMAPRVLLGSVAGVFVDRWDRKRTMVVADVLRAGLLLFLLAARSADEIWIVYVVAAAQSGIGAFFAPARAALVPRLVPAGQLLAANALNGLTGSLASLLAPALGGLLVAALGLPAVVLLDSASFLASAVAIACIAAPVGRGADRPPPASFRFAQAWLGVWREWIEGLRLIRRRRPLGAVCGLHGLVHGGMGITAALFVVFLRQVYGGGALELGWWLAAQGAGGLAAGGLAVRMGRVRSPAGFIAAALIARGAILLVQLHAPHLWLALALAAVSMAAGVVYTVSADTLCQASTADGYRGRIFGALDTTTALAMLAGMTLGSALGDTVGVVPLFHATAGLWLLAGLLAGLTLRGQTVPHGAEPRAPRPAAAGDGAPGAKVDRQSAAFPRPVWRSPARAAALA